MDKKHNNDNKQGSGLKLVAPFLAVLGILTVVSFIIPLRPTQSGMEKRNLAEFPEFSMEALLSGDYFDDITTWFSDTFPGREGWLAMSSNISSLHGYSEIAIQGELPDTEVVPPVQIQEKPDSEQPGDLPRETVESTQAASSAEPTEWGGVHMDDNVDIEIGQSAVIQIGDSAFNAVGFSQQQSERYAQTLNELADLLAPFGTTVVSAPAPTAVGIMIEPEYLEKLKCADQKETIGYMHSNLNDDVVAVDTYAALIGHNDEYIYFRTDHHWTALGAYYAYAAISEALGDTPASLEDFELWDQGDFEGSLYWKVVRPKKLKMDTLYSYIPQGDLETAHYNEYGYPNVGGLLDDMTNQEANTKYMTFISGDNPMTEITNHSIPEGKSCVLIKDSFGNPLAVFLTQNYHKVYVLDYRKYRLMNLQKFVEKNEIDDVIFAPYVIATQSFDGNDMFKRIGGIQ